MNNLIDEFRNSETARKMVRILSEYKGRPVNLMEVCGTHTMSIFRFGIRDVLPESIRLLSGPGCPVCVTPNYFIDAAIELAKMDDVIITTFGDMMRVPGNGSSLLEQKASGKDIRIVYSPLDSLKIAANNPDKKVVFLSVGFETTTPVSALTVIKAKEEGINNFYLLSANKTMPEVLKTLCLDPEVNIDGFIYPGHVSVITGTAMYDEIAEKYGMPGVIAGFEPLDILHAIIRLVSNIMSGRVLSENGYKRAVNPEGNPVALARLYEVFEPCDARWRGIGLIPGSGLKMRDAYADYDAWKAFDIKVLDHSDPKGCLCGEVLKGKRTPKECKLFNTICTPENPVGACMVSSEGTCAAYYKYDMKR